MTTATSPGKPSANELLKQSSPTLSGTIAQTLAQPEVDRFSDDDNQFLKFHGIYQQDDRDLRKTGKKYIMMIRLRLPGGTLTPQQYLVCDDLATRYANHTLRVTSRQGIQFHGVVKAGLGPLVKSVNEALMTTLAACGDNMRNVMAPPTSDASGLAAQTREHARQIAAALTPRTEAYHSIWIEGVPLNLEDPAHRDFVDPLYGATYLPRKFKIGFAIPPLNDVDIFTHCCGFIAIADPAGQLLGYNLAVGGGMGRTHGNAATFPRLAEVIGFLPSDKTVAVSRAVLTIHRDFGDRSDRKHARLKYLLADRGAAWFREELQRRLDFPMAAARPFRFEQQADPFGWHAQADGRLCLGLFVETGRIRDKDGCRLRSGLRRVVELSQAEVRLTPGNNVILGNIAPGQQAEITRLLAEHGVDLKNQGSLLRRASMACVALPTCGLALAESERYLPDLISQFETVLAEVGLANEEIIIRMTGCPNGCARPYMAEIGLVGKGPGRYQVYLGGNEGGTRLNRLHNDNVKAQDIIPELRPLLARFATERLAGERFGDWCARVLWTSEPIAAAATPNT